MSNHFHLLSFFCMVFFIIAESSPICNLVEKNSSEMKYEFNCDGNPLKIECDEKDEIRCEVILRSRLLSVKYRITSDQIESLELFSKKSQTLSSCDMQYKICSITKDDCVGFKNAYQAIVDGNANGKQIGLNQKCEPTGLGAVKQFENFSNQLILKGAFSKKDCQDKSNAAMDTLQNELKTFRKNISLPVTSPNNFMNACLVLKDGSAKHAEFISKNKQELSDIQQRIISQSSDVLEIKKLICDPEISKIYQGETLNFDLLMCLLVEEARIAFRTKSSSFRFACSDSEVSRFMSSENNFDVSLKSGLIASKSDGLKIEEKAFPDTLKKLGESPVGLVSALAKIDAVGAENTMSSQAQERQIASSATRSIFSDDQAFQAGEIIRPVYDKLSSIANSMNSLGSSSSRERVIGRDDSSYSPRSAVIGKTVLQNGVRVPQGNVAAVNVKTPDSGVPTDVESVSAARATNGPAKPGLSIGNVKLAGSSTNPSSGLISNSGNGVGGYSSSLGGDSNGNASATTDAAPSSPILASDSVAKIAQKLGPLKTSDQVKKFFTSDAKAIPGFRQLIYTNKKIRQVLESKKIKVVSKDGRVSSENADFEPDYLFSDNGNNFIPLKLKSDK